MLQLARRRLAMLTIGDSRPEQIVGRRSVLPPVAVEGERVRLAADLAVGGPPLREVIRGSGIREEVGVNETNTDW